MMRIKLLILFVAICRFAVAQVPESAEDISPLLISEKVPSVEITSLDGKQIPIDQVVAGKKTVLLFYRGGWCPYCNAHLAAVGESEKNILELGYQIIGIAPDSPEELKNTMDNNKLSYQLYSDADASLIQAMGIAFEVEEKRKERLTQYSGGKNPGMLPVPSLFVIDEEGTIVFEYISPNYKDRISTELLLAVLKSLAN